MSQMNLVVKIQKNIRWHDWAIDKLPILFGLCFYIILSLKTIEISQLIEFSIFLIFSISSTIFGYMINNYADLKIDLEQGKENAMADFSQAGRIVFLIIITLIVIISGLFFRDKDYFLWLWGIQFFISAFYSLPPIRFKERGFTGLIIPFLAQLVVPTLIVFSIFGFLTPLEVTIFLLYGFFKGGAYDIGHQFHDYMGDSKTSTKTFAVTRGRHIVKAIFKIFLVMERFLFLSILFLTTRLVSKSFDEIFLYGFIILLILYLFLFIAVFVQEIKNKEISDPYYVNIRGYANIIHIIIPNIAFPLTLTILISTENYVFFTVFLFFLIWIMPTPSKLKWPLQVILGKFRS
jgi:4-hydroxybenzoate polyprenyltransferase